MTPQRPRSRQAPSPRQCAVLILLAVLAVLPVCAREVPLLNRVQNGKRIFSGTDACQNYASLLGRGLDLEGPIGPAAAAYVEDGLAAAAAAGAPALVLRIDTPGGLDALMRTIVKAITASPVPVLGYVAPTGARAASAGTISSSPVTWRPWPREPTWGRRPRCSSGGGPIYIQARSLRAERPPGHSSLSSVYQPPCQSLGTQHTRAERAAVPPYSAPSLAEPPAGFRPTALE